MNEITDFKLLERTKEITALGARRRKGIVRSALEALSGTGKMVAIPLNGKSYHSVRGNIGYNCARLNMRVHTRCDGELIYIWEAE